MIMSDKETKHESEWGKCSCDKSEALLLEPKSSLLKDCFRVGRVLWEIVKGFKTMRKYGPCVTVFGIRLHINCITCVISPWISSPLEAKIIKYFCLKPLIKGNFGGFENFGLIPNCFRAIRNKAGIYLRNSVDPRQ